MKLDITLYPNSNNDEWNHDFIGYQNVITSLYTFHLNNYKPTKVSRISISMSSQDNVGFLFGSICSPTVAFDLTSFEELNKEEKYKTILENLSMLCYQHIFSLFLYAFLAA